MLLSAVVLRNPIPIGSRALQRFVPGMKQFTFHEQEKCGLLARVGSLFRLHAAFRGRITQSDSDRKPCPTKIRPGDETIYFSRAGKMRATGSRGKLVSPPCCFPRSYHAIRFRSEAVPYKDSSRG